MEDLWPDDMDFSVTITPVSILREQASNLGRKTRNVIQARVIREPDVPSKGFCYEFQLVVPALGPYNYSLFSMSYDVTMYPVTIRGDRDVIQEIGEGQNEIVADSEDDFKERLRRILGSRKTRTVIRALMSQVAEDDSEHSETM